MTKTEILRQIAASSHPFAEDDDGAGSGHPTTCLSAADLAAACSSARCASTLGTRGLGERRIRPSKGHAAPILWAAYAEAGIIPLRDLLDLRKIRSDLEGHPTPRVPWVKAATGSLGQGLVCRRGPRPARSSASRRAGNRPDGRRRMRRGRRQGGGHAAPNLRLRNLCAIVDIDRLGQSDPTMHEHDLGAYARKFRAFGWDVLDLDGHKMDEVSRR